MYRHLIRARSRIDLGLPDKSELAYRRDPHGLDGAARHVERSKVEALDLGADDCLSKPFGMAEQTARLLAGARLYVFFISNPGYHYGILMRQMARCRRGVYALCRRTGLTLCG
jgi:hypothetical protein